jgi:hypothetical protein
MTTRTTNAIAALEDQAVKLTPENRHVALKDLPELTWHITNPLIDAGIHYVDQLDQMPVEEIARYVNGRKTLPTLMKALGRTEEYQRFKGNYLVEVTNEDGEVLASYPASSLRQIAPLSGTAHYFGFGSGSELRAALEGGVRVNSEGVSVPFGLADIARYKYIRDTAVAEAGGSEVLESVDLEGIVAFQLAVEETAQSYAADYDTTQFNRTDWDNLRALAAMKLRVARLQGILGIMDVTQSVIAAKAGNEIATESTTTLREIRQLEDALGVSLKARIQRERSRAAADVFTEFAQNAKDFMATAAIIIYCPKCAADGRGIRLMTVVPHFPRHVLTTELEMQCPRCAHVFMTNIVPQRLLDSYVESADFMPDDMPEAIRQELAKRGEVV